MSLRTRLNRVTGAPASESHIVGEEASTSNSSNQDIRSETVASNNPNEAIQDLSNAIRERSTEGSPNRSAQPAIAVNSVSKHYEGTVVFDELTLEVADGEFLCLLGPSGCGKTTLLHMLAGIESPTGGEIRAYGDPVTGPDYRRGVVFQKPLLYPWLSVRANVALGARLRGEKPDDERVERLLELVGLAEVGDARPESLSGGMAQRASLARTLANDPELLLFDEPFSALDELTKRTLQDEIRQTVDRFDLTAVFVTHDIEEAIYLGDRVVVLGTDGTGIAGIESVEGVGRPHEDPDSLTHRRRIVELLGVDDDQ